MRSSSSSCFSESAWYNRRVCRHPFTWYSGGRPYLAERILGRFPPHQVYVGANGGTANVLLKIGGHGRELLWNYR